MPRFNRRRSRRPRRRRRRRRRTTRSIAVRALRASTNERQAFEQVYNNVAVQQGTEFLVLPLAQGIVQGTAQGSRLGNVITFLSADVRLMFRTDPALVDASNFVRIMYIYDRQSDGALPVDTDILEPVQTADLFLNIQRFRSIPKSRRWTVLFDRTINLSDGFKPFLQFKMHVNFRGKQMKFSGSDGTIANVEFGAIYMLIGGTVADTGAVTGFSGIHRLRFRY